MCNISAELVVSSALQTIEGDVSRLDIAFQSTLCYFFRKSFAMIIWYFISQETSFRKQYFRSGTHEVSFRV